MKKHLRSFLITLASLLVVAHALGNISFESGTPTILKTALVLTLTNIIIRPIMNLLLLPINLLTLGLFRWLVSVFIFYLTTLLVPQLKIQAYQFPGWNYRGFIIPQLELSFFWTLVLVCFIISFVTSFLYWAFKK